MRVEYLVTVHQRGRELSFVAEVPTLMYLGQYMVFTTVARQSAMALHMSAWRV